MDTADHITTPARGIPMYVILRNIKGRWEVAAQDVPAEAIERAMHKWRVRGYEVTSARQP
jgi:hypothetical protein